MIKIDKCQRCRQGNLVVEEFGMTLYFRCTYCGEWRKKEEYDANNTCFQSGKNGRVVRAAVSFGGVDLL